VDTLLYLEFFVRYATVLVDVQIPRQIEGIGNIILGLNEAKNVASLSAKIYAKCVIDCRGQWQNENV
jgi:hypothetical protein